MDLVSLETKDPNRFTLFSDYDQVSDWANIYVKKVLAANVFNGTSQNTISPKENLTHAEALSAIRNLLLQAELIN